MDDNIENLSEVLRAYIQRIPMNDTQFARELGISPGEFSRRKNGHKDFEIANARRVLEVLAKHGAITNKAQARNLLHLMNIPDLPTGDWNNEPLKSLKDVEYGQPRTPHEQPTSVVPHAPLVAQSSGDINLQSSPQSSPALAQRPKGIVTRHKGAIAFSVILIVAALVAGSSFIVWGLFHKAPTLPAVSWSSTRAITCGDLFNPVNPAEQIPTTPTNTNSNITTCATTSDSHVILSFRKIQNGSPELDIKEGHGPSSSTYRVTLRMDLSPTAGVPQIAGCIVMDTRPDEDIGEVVCVHSNGLIEVLDAATMGSGSKSQHLEDDKVVLVNDPANVPVVVERVDNQLYIEVADQVIQPVDLTTAAGNIGFLAVGTQGSLQMSAIELA